MNRSAVVSVTQLNRYIKAMLDSDSALDGLMVRGEISNFLCHYKSGHMYFTLKDETAAIKTVMFRGHASQLRFKPENGMSVIVSGSVSLYERDGSYQFYATDMQPDGVGALYLAFEQLKEKLAREGLFDEGRKRPLPRYPERIGVVTSEGAAALQDILNILSRRYPLATVVLYPAQVQGEGAAKTIAAGVRALNAAHACDVMIVGRGGGSAEDLWAFNDEALARVIAASEIPVISAVGHEVDFTIADFVADRRAPTPSAAAELVAPNIADVRYYLSDLMERCAAQTQGRVVSLQLRMRAVQAGLAASESVLQNLRQRVETLGQAARAAFDQRLSGAREQVRYLSALAEERSPMHILSRGYSLTSSKQGPVSSIDQVRVGEPLFSRLADGEIISQVIETRGVEHGKGDDA
ncbi:exodeoxyribonuclease VII large subunit [Anaerotruncus colihominis]|uniref:exodeoxyribonuclease VII large subunit n=1 Tax=Anaerotruncus colihominis TaxID=169435 RepID=UPI0035191C10